LTAQRALGILCQQLTMSSITFRERPWTRVELVSMDGQCNDLTIALYRQDTPDGTIGIVHTYSSVPGAQERVRFVAGAMRTLGDLAAAGDDPAAVAFPCGTWHAAIARRLFLEAVKVDQTAPVTPRPLELVDQKTGQTIVAEPTGGGSYRLTARDVGDDAPSRAGVASRGLRKLAELPDAGDEPTASFACGADHHALVGLLLPRAVNVRQAIREEEAMVGRGLLTAPGAQE
jgi:hypothetical protein